MNKKIYVALAVLVLVAMACGTGSTASSSKVLFQDKFTNTNSGWPHYQTANSTMDYATGGYHINVTKTDLLTFAKIGKSFQSDVSIEVDATKIAGPDDNYIGVICRYVDVNNFYFFAISSDGYAGIAMYKNNTMSMLSGGNFEPSSAIKQGAATNHLRADCVGTTLTLYVGGTQVSTVTDSTFTAGGDAGLMARANGTAGVDILFSNFVVSKP